MALRAPESAAAQPGESTAKCVSARQPRSLAGGLRALACDFGAAYIGGSRGCSSVVEQKLPKLRVEGSIPFTRSSFFPSFDVPAAAHDVRRMCLVEGVVDLRARDGVQARLVHLRLGPAAGDSLRKGDEVMLEIVKRNRVLLAREARA
jgi:hypothetical protein